MNETSRAGAAVGAIKPAVRFAGVTKRYGSVVAVADVSFDIAPATLVTLLGPSGCGKTTTLRLIAGLEHASEGRIVIDDADVTHLSAAERDVSMVFQSYALFPHMNVMENVCYGLRSMGMTRAQASERAAAKLALVGLTGYEKRQPSELSGGQQQRVAVARAIVLEPKVLLFDEPLSNLDAKLRRRVRGEIRDLQQQLKLTVVYVTHDQEEALAVSDRIIVMNAARVEQDGSPRQLYNEPSSRFIADFMGDANVVGVTGLERRGDRVSVQVGPMRIDVADRAITAGPAALAVRPHSVRIAEDVHLPNALTGRILKSSYLGDHMEYRILLTDPVAELFVSAPDVATPIPEGRVVGVTFDPAEVILIADR
ncbi:MAG TPA: ABC transporter ATP-binding protein [Casimicrobiaceae bacterium]|jgi:iron(III) transport system ATP-binding protein|nr:ABC transporter ATP-binding protein [Casimicrobiaceae bacterium]